MGGAGCVGAEKGGGAVQGRGEGPRETGEGAEGWHCGVGGME